IPAEEVVPADKGVSVASSNKGKGIAVELSVPQRKQTPQEIKQKRLSMLEIDRLKAQDEEEREKRLADLSKSDSEYRAQQAKPMTHGDTVKFTRTYIKNMSAAYYSSGRTMEWANKFKGDDLIAEYNKIKSVVERSATSQGPSLGSTPADEVPADTGVSPAESVPAD
nr:hypothetical protein [Tanacetum cinerariifolium]